MRLAVLGAIGEHKGYDYSRTANPTRRALETCLSSLESAEYGFAFSSGMGATTTLMHLVSPGERVVAVNDVYGGTYRFLERVARPRGVGTRYVDLAGDPAASLAAAVDERTRLVWFETPSNPHLKLVDIAAVTGAVGGRRGGSAERPLIVVDNTFASPALQRPLALGADVVFHSSTKYLAGHSDTVNGIAVTDRDDVAERLRFLQNAGGAVPGPFDCFLVLRGLRTLALRIERHAANAAAVARFLAERDDVEWVRYPGLATGPHAHPQAALASRQMRAGGGMVSFIPRAGGRHARSARERAIAVCESVRLFILAESLGGVESLIELPAVMTHASVAGSPLAVEDALIRLSVGIEGADDLIDDLGRALDEA